MTRDEAVAFHRELEDLSRLGPGTGVPRDERDRRPNRIRIAFGGDPSVDSYFREKVREACSDLEIWLSPRRWQQWGSDPARFGHILNNAVYNVRRAIDARFPRREGDNS